MEESYVVRNSADLFSPALLYYEDKIRRNLKKALEIAGGPKRLWPHVKTHKTREIVMMAMEQGIRQFKCATIAEAEMLATCGAVDVLLAYPLVGPNVARFLRLIDRYPATRFSSIVDDAGAIRALSKAAVAHGVRADVLLDLDTGLHRTGVEAGDEAVQLYCQIATSEGLRPKGLHSYDGQNHQHDLSERTAAAEACYQATMDLRQRLVSKKLPVETIVMGGTPTLPCYARHHEVDLSPGTCFLQDWGYASSFPDLAFEPAALLFARVVSANRRALVFCLDLGCKAIASDPQGARGVIWNLEGCVPVLQNEEHWVFRVDAEKLPVVGQEVYVFPTHICPTSALHAKACVIDAERRWYSEWKVVARDRTLGV